MAMAEFFNPNQPQEFDPNTFNYGTEQEKIKRKRALADMLMQQSQQSTPTQTVPGPNGGFAVPQSKFSPLVKALQMYIGLKGNELADGDQSALDTNSQAALEYQLGAEDRKKQAAIDAQLQREADAEMLRESRRSSSVDAGVEVSQDVPSATQAFPVEDRSRYIETRPLPPVTQNLAKTLAKPAPFVSGGGGQFNGHGATGSWGDEPQAALPPASAVGAPQGAVPTSTKPSPLAQQLQDQPAQQTGPAQQPAAPVLPNVQAAPQPQSQPQPPAQQGPVGDQRMLTQQVRISANVTGDFGSVTASEPMLCCAGQIV